VARVNLQTFLSGINHYASAQALDLLATTKNGPFPNKKQHCCIPEYADENYLVSVCQGPACTTEETVEKK